MGRSVKSEVEYCSRLVSQCQRRVHGEFEQFFAEQYSGGDAKNGQAGNGDVMLFDDQEKFESLQMQRLLEEHPDSCAFYNAKKNADRRYHAQLQQQGGVARNKSKRATQPVRAAMRGAPPSTLTTTVG